MHPRNGQPDGRAQDRTRDHIARKVLPRLDSSYGSQGGESGGAPDEDEVLHFDTLATTLETRRAGLVAWFQHPITTGPVEGLNNKIKVLKRVAYGYRDDEYFKLRLLTLHEARVALTAG